jgi:dolichol-phosphate mannosyltransferase
MDEILAQGEGIHILVIDDASPDGTASVISEHPFFGARVHLLKRKEKLGLGTAYREGLRWGLERVDYDIFIQMDADHSHSPEDIPRLLAEIEAGMDCVIGSRYLGGVRVLNWPLHRLFISVFAGAYTRFFTKLPLTDPTSGFKAIHRDALIRLPWQQFTSGGYSFQIEEHYYLWRKKAKLKEIPIIFTERQVGKSKMDLIVILEAALRVLQLLFRKI